MSGRKSQMVGTLFTILLFLVFVLCALFSVLIGGKVYENINARTENSYQGVVALSYISNKVRQTDEKGQVSMTDVDGITVLKLEQKINDSVYATDIYYKDGSLWELFAESGSGLGVEDGTEVMECNPVAMEMNGDLLHIKTEGEGGGNLWFFLRSGGSNHE